MDTEMNTVIDNIVFENEVVFSDSGTIRFQLTEPHTLCGEPCTEVLLVFRSSKEVYRTMSGSQSTATAEMEIIAVKTVYDPWNGDRQRTTVKYWQDQNIPRGILWLANNIQSQNTNKDEN